MFSTQVRSLDQNAQEFTNGSAQTRNRHTQEVPLLDLMVIVLGASVTVFIMSKNKVVDEINTRVNAITASYSTVNEVNSKGMSHPNEHSQSQMEVIIDVHKKTSKKHGIAV